MLYYIQIKTKVVEYNNFSHWNFPPIWVDVVEANSKKEAKEKVEKDYNKKFPLRVLQKDIEKNEFLLSIKEIKEGDTLYKKLYTKRKCEICGQEYTILEQYQFHNVLGTTYRVCSVDCYEKLRKKEEIERLENKVEYYSKYKKKIYKITNKKTGKVYIGQTAQPVTYRWFQHLTATDYNKNKFHKALKECGIENFTFEVIEIVDDDVDVLERERYWIEKYNSINEGYNTK